MPGGMRVALLMSGAALVRGLGVRMTTRGLACVASLLLALCAPASAGAQPADSFGDLSRRLHRGDTVVVEARDGGRHEGAVVSVAPDVLVIDTPAGHVRFVPAATARIIRRGDSVLNGALAGALPAFLVGLQVPRSASEQRHGGGSGVKAGLITAVIGAVIGTTIDSAHDGEAVVFTAPAAPAVAFAPILARGAVGAGLALRW